MTFQAFFKSIFLNRACLVVFLLRDMRVFAVDFANIQFVLKLTSTCLHSKKYLGFPSDMTDKFDLRRDWCGFIAIVNTS